MQNFYSIFESNHAVEASSQLEQSDFAKLNQTVGDLFSNGESPDRTVHSAVYEILTARLVGERDSECGWAYLPAASLLLLSYDQYLQGYSQIVGVGNELQLPLTQKKLTDEIKGICNNSSCSINHPLFAYISSKATKPELGYILASENPCDLNFVHLLSLLLPGISGSPALEIIDNFYDEMGRGQLDSFHATMRLKQMASAGLKTDDSILSAENYFTSELRHFNAYALNGFRRDRHFYLIGMMFATEFLVPSQLEVIVNAWCRTGTPASDMKYMSDHLAGDVEHGEGWGRSVVGPLCENNVERQRAVLMGVGLHIAILTTLYDNILDALTSGEWRESKLLKKQN